ncbi:MAG TPA: hypothetical protein VGM03_19210, partial [Phycisphaerae bacterium]
ELQTKDASWVGILAEKLINDLINQRGLTDLPRAAQHHSRGQSFPESGQHRFERPSPESRQLDQTFALPPGIGPANDGLQARMQEIRECELTGFAHGESHDHFRELIGVGMVASTRNGSIARAMFLTTSGRSTSTSSLGGGLLAMHFSVACGTMT